MHPDPYIPRITFTIVFVLFLILAANEASTDGSTWAPLTGFGLA